MAREVGCAVEMAELPDGEASKVLPKQESLFRRLRRPAPRARRSADRDRRRDRARGGDLLGGGLVARGTPDRAFRSRRWASSTPRSAARAASTCPGSGAISSGRSTRRPRRSSISNWCATSPRPTDVRPWRRRSSTDSSVTRGSSRCSRRHGVRRRWARRPKATELLELVERCVLAKRRVVLRDERDTGDVRISLNLGHTLSHALEAATGYRMRHGEAVAYGLRAALGIGTAMGVTPRPIAARAERLLRRLELAQERSTFRGGCPGYIESDKKRSGGTVTMGPGRGSPAPRSTRTCRPTSSARRSVPSWRALPQSIRIS